MRATPMRFAPSVFAVLVTIVMSNISIAADESNIPPATGFDAIAAQLRSAIAHEMKTKNLPAFSIALVVGDRAVWAEGFGHQDMERKIPATARTVYRVGSVSKLFTDVAVMQLVERGKLRLDSPVTVYLPEFQPRNPFARPITLDQLTSHRSGLVRESPVGSYFDPTEPTLAATNKSLNDTSLVYEPGTRTKYSNAGISVVGQVVERVAKQEFSRRIEESILRPLGMLQSGFVPTPEIKHDLAAGWMWTYDGRRFEAPKFSLGTLPAGNLYSSVGDLAKFVSALFDPSGLRGKERDAAILQRKTLDLMMTAKSNDPADARRFGIGFSVSELDGQRVIGHGGAVYGFSTQLSAIPAKKIGVIAVSSLDGSNGVVKRLNEYALRLLLAHDSGATLPAYQATEPVPVDRAQAIVGQYRAGNDEVEIVARPDRLVIRYGDFRYDVRQFANRLVIDDALAYGPELNFVDSGAVDIGGKRYEPVQQRTASIPGDAPERWKGLIGEYGWDHNTLYILEDRGQLYALIEWFYYYPLREINENEFAFPDIGPGDKGLYHGEKLIFKRDAMRQATHVVAANVEFKRREVGTAEGVTFRIKPRRPIDELRAAALADKPPIETKTFREPNLTEPSKLDPTIKLDIRYASTNNFTGTKFYRQARAYLQKPAAEAVVRANARLKDYGFGILIHDAYRPWHVTKMFWDATPDPMRQFVANPANGSRHNRGCAVDLTLYDLRSGEPVSMVSGYDEFSHRAFPDYPGGTSRQRWCRELLRNTMEAEGFTVYENEWWHFDYHQWREFAIGNRTFEELEQP